MAENNNPEDSLPLPMGYTDLEKICREKGIKYLLPVVTAFNGEMRGPLVPVKKANDLMRNGFAFFAIAQYQMSMSDPEMYGVPDPSTLIQLPWKPEIGWLACNLYHFNRPMPQCPRRALIRLQVDARKQGFIMKTGIEPEFILLKPNKHEELDTDEKDLVVYHEPFRLLNRADMMCEMLDIMENLGWEPYQVEHEAMGNQYEINFGYADAVTTADRHAFLKFMVKELARKHGFRATFMPSPFNGKFMGSGLHLNISLWSTDTGKNIFPDPSSDMTISQTAQQFTAGIMEHAEALTAMVCPTVNSYKRMHGSSIGAYTISYGVATRFPMIRIPADNRLEYRTPDGAANPYLLQAAALAAGLDGVSRKLELKPGERITTQSSIAECPKGIRTLPKSLMEACDYLRKDTHFQEQLGKELVLGFIAKKEEQWESFMKTVTEWEIDQADEY